MKKIVLTLSLLFGIYWHSQAQFMAGGQLGPVFPIGEFSDALNPGFGLGGEVKYLANENVMLGLNISWYSFGTGFDDYDFNVTPLLFSAEYLIPQTSGFTPYVGLGLGPYRIANRIRISGVRTTSSFTEFGIAPTIGALYPLNDQLDINANLKLNLVFTEENVTVFIPLNVGILVRVP